MEIAIIVAVADNGVIGIGGALPWHLPGDLRRFRERTLGHHVVMGRHTFVSIGRPLPGRHNVVLSRDPTLQLPGCTVVASLAAAIDVARAGGDDEAFVIGGAALYREALPIADRIYLTRVHASPPGDTYFAPLDPAQWNEVATEVPQPEPRPQPALQPSPRPVPGQPRYDVVVLERHGLRPRTPRP